MFDPFRHPTLSRKIDRSMADRRVCVAQADSLQQFNHPYFTMTACRATHPTNRGRHRSICQQHLKSDSMQSKTNWGGGRHNWCAGLLLRHGDIGHQVQKKIKEKLRIALGAASSCGCSARTRSPVYADRFLYVVDSLPSLTSRRKNGCSESEFPLLAPVLPRRAMKRPQG